jgi:hypothetical protein
MLLCASCNNQEAGEIAAKADSLETTTQVEEIRLREGESLLCAFLPPNTDEDTADSSWTIYPICVVSPDSIWDASLCFDMEDKPADEDAILKQSILSASKEYVLVEVGQGVANLTLDSLVVRRFHCLMFCVGKTDLDAANRPVRSEWLGLNATSDLLETQPVTNAVSDSMAAAVGIYDMLKREYLNSGFSVGDVDRAKLLYAASSDFDGDGSSEILVGSQIETDSVLYSYSAVFDVGGQPMPIWELRDRAIGREGDRSHRIVDLVDLDGDRIPEVVVRSTGYEGFGYQIYRYQARTFERIFWGASAGC